MDSRDSELVILRIVERQTQTIEILLSRIERLESKMLALESKNNQISPSWKFDNNTNQWTHENNKWVKPIREYQDENRVTDECD